MTTLRSAALLFLAACAGPMEFDVINYTGGKLFLSLPTASADGEGTIVKEYTIPERGGSFEFNGAPLLNNTYDVQIIADGVYSMTTKNVEGIRGEVVPVTFNESDINAFVVVVRNDTAQRIDSLYFKPGNQDSGRLTDGEQPGANYGPIRPGNEIELSLRHLGDEGYSYIAYQGTGSIVNALGSVNTKAPGEDTTLDFF